ncbi:MAG: DUF4159 domain-containing protein [Bacteroidetes bacterium]|nr:MAG: DUF4159 domain-containing protein [Bacteroidota bacterium]REK32494.1 MAG: DUF4159 domain-containing protein [Bacteroidota bacterium]REK49059.1 MAG: DUF4159 domain-containing protein [Bacteroidota bacterium]
MKKLFLVALLMGCKVFASEPSFKIAVLKYNGGGDWYANLETSLPNLIRFCNDKLKTNIHPEQAIVEVSSPDIFNYPFIHMTGHGNWVLNNQESENLRKYLAGGGFLHIDDNYGLDPYVRPQMKKVFPELDFVELPFSHPIYNQKFSFNKGLPKIHEHDNKAPQGFGLIHEGRLVCFYTYECDLGDGWEDPEIHRNSAATREKALQMGANIIQYAFTQQ